MDRNEIKKRVFAVITENLGIDAEKVTEEATFKVDLQFDSIEIYDFIDALQESFADHDLEIDDKDILQISTVKDAISFIGKKLG